MKTTPCRRGFTLLELLVVLVIVILVSVIALPTVISAVSHRQVGEGSRLLRAALAGARDQAIRSNAPSGIRLLPDPAYPLNWINGQIDPTQPLAYNRWVPIQAAPEYSEGFCTPVTPGTISQLGAALVMAPGIAANYPYALFLLENPVATQTGAPQPPTSWWWNVRVGDKIQLANAGPWYTIIGPMAYGPSQGNAEMFCNVGPPAPLVTYAAQGTAPTVGGQPAEFLVLVNGVDDNNNGWVDEEYDGIDNNGDSIVDNLPEWSPITAVVNGQTVVYPGEKEIWQGSVLANTQLDVPYTIQRRPAPSPNAREIALPSSVVIDATSWGTTQERSRLPVNPYTGNVDVLLGPDGTVVPTVIYSTPASFSMAGAFFHFFLSERQDVVAPQLNYSTTPPTPVPLATLSGNAFFLPIAPVPPSVPYSGPTLQGEYGLTTLNSRTGQVTSTATPAFFYDTQAGYTSQPVGTWTFSSNNPFIPAQQGISGP